MDSSREGLYRVVRTIASPLRFFAVASVALALIVLGLAWKSTLPADITATLIIIAFVGLMLLIVVVTALVLFAPKKLVFDQEAHLAVLRERLGDSELGRQYFAGELPNVFPNRLLPTSEEE